MKIINVERAQDFTIEVKPPSGYLGFKKDGTAILNPPLILLPDKPRSKFIKENGEERVAIAVEVPRNAAKGQYILNVEIKKEDGNNYASVVKIHVNVP